MRTGKSLPVAARRLGWATALAVACASASPASAEDAGNPVKSVMKLLGFAADPPQPQDFVVTSRPAKQPDYIPVFQPPPEPARPVLNGKQLNALKGDLDSVERRADAARAAFPQAEPAPAEPNAKTAKAKNAPKAPKP